MFTPTTTSEEKASPQTISREKERKKYDLFVLFAVITRSSHKFWFENYCNRITMSSRVTKIDKPPMLPPKNNIPDPDYEIIEFSNEQYSNAQPIKAASMCHFPNMQAKWFAIICLICVSKSRIDVKVLEGIKCELCGSMTAKLRCDQCNQQLFCSSCDDMFHRHPKRNMHIRKVKWMVSLKTIDISNW